MKRSMHIPKILVAISVALFAAQPSCLADSFQDYRANDPHKPVAWNEPSLEFASVSNEQIISNANALLKAGQYDRAMHLASELVKRDTEYGEVYRINALALEGKLNQKSGYDSETFKKCVEQWLLFMRAPLRGEGHVSLGGVGVSNFFPKRDENYELARQHLVDLTGIAPKPWETNQKYMKRALESAKTANTSITPGPGL